MLHRAVRVAVRRSTMTVLVEIVCSIAQEESTQATVEAFCKETGGQPIGRRINQETQKVKLTIRLPQTAGVSGHATPLSQALQQKVIESFRYVIGDLVQISFNPSENLQEQMQNFPLRRDESWFPAIHVPHQAYVCMSMPVMLAKQAAWLLTHEVEWTFM